MMLFGYSLYQGLSDAMYGVLAIQALWGMYCVVLVWNRVNQKRFKNEEQQDAFLDDVEEMVEAGDFNGAAEYCEGDVRGLPQMIALAIENRSLGLKRARTTMLDRFQRDVMSDIEYTLNWVSTMIKTGPMVGLFGTVFGMIEAFMELGSGNQPNPAILANGISHALSVTLVGVAIAVPSIAVNTFFRNRITQVSLDVSHVADDLLTQMYHNSKKPAPPAGAAPAPAAAPR